MKELARTDLVFVQKLRKFVQKILKRLDVFRQASACPYERSLGIKKESCRYPACGRK